MAWKHLVAVNRRSWKAIVALMCVATATAGRAAQAPQGAASPCLPTCAVDGRFFVVTGHDPSTLSAAWALADLWITQGAL